MPNILKPDMSRAWANNGQKTKPSDAIIDLGWIAEKPPFQTENWEQNRADVWMQHLEERGVPEWDNQIIYSLNSMVYSQEQVWVSLQNSNLNHTPLAGDGWFVPLSELSTPPAMLSTYAGVSAPAGWLACQGAAVSRTTYARLFSFIGTTFGVGDGSTTFNLPNLVNRTVIGFGGTVAGVGDNVGETQTTLAISNLPAHNHPVVDPGHAHEEGEGSAAVNIPGTDWTGGGAKDSKFRDTHVSLSSPTGISIGNTGSATPISNFQPSMGMLWIIKT